MSNPIQLKADRTPGNARHDTHGISRTQGNAVNNSKFINFDTTISRPGSGGQLKFVASDINKGSCYPTCHGKNHNPFSY